MQHCRDITDSWKLIADKESAWNKLLKKGLFVVLYDDNALAINIKPLVTLDQKLRVNEAKYKRQLTKYYKDLEKSALQQASKLRENPNRPIRISPAKEAGLARLNKQFFKDTDKLSADKTKRQLLNNFRGKKDRQLIIEAKREKQKKYNNRHADKLATKQFNDYQRELQAVIKKAVKDNPGISTNELKEVIREKSQGFIKRRARATAETESIRVSNDSRLEIYNQLQDKIKGVIFVAVLDERTSVTCQTRNGLVFKLNSPDLAANTPPLHVNCRSHLEYLPAKSKVRATRKSKITKTEKEAPAKNTRVAMKIS